MWGVGVVVVAQVSGRGSVRVLLWVSVKLFNKGRLPRNCIVSMWLSVEFDDAIPRNDGVYMRVLFLIPAGWLCCAGVLLWVSVKLFNKGRLPQNCIHTACVSLRFLDAIPRNDDIYIRVAEILPLSFHFSVRLWCGYYF